MRTGRRIPGVRPLAGVHAPISVIRMAVDDAYGAKEWREQEDGDEVAYRTERIERSVCRMVSEFAFFHARRSGAKVFGGPKYTVSPVYEGMLKEEMDAAAARYPRRPVRAAAHRRDLRAPDLDRRRPDGDPVAQPRRRLPVGSGDAAVRLDRRGRVDADVVHPRRQARRRDDRGAARHRAAPVRQERRQPDGDDPRRGRAALVRTRTAARAAPRARSTNRRSKPCTKASRPAIWADTPRRPTSPTPSSRRSRRNWRSGARSRRALRARGCHETAPTNGRGPVSCMVTNSVAIAPMVIARPL